MLKWIAGGAAAFLALRYLLRLNTASKTITTRTSIQVHKVGLSGMDLKAKVTLQNPNPISLSLQHPYVQVIYQGARLGASIIRDEVIQIAPNSERTFEIDIQSEGWLTLIGVLGTELANRIRKGEKSTLDLLVTISTRVNNIPIMKEERIKLNI